MAVETSPVQCGTCCYFRPGKGQGHCHRYPPGVPVYHVRDVTGSVVPLSGPDTTTFPIVNDREWCGEYWPTEEGMPRTTTVRGLPDAT